MTVTVDDWHGLYGAGWKSEIVPDAFAHPAKFSRALIRHIYQHCVEQGWLAAGDSVVDPFGGVALGGLDAMRLGLHWVGCELEPRFVALGNENIALWNKRYVGRFRVWGTATILQGDSRRLADIVRQADACIASPPYAGTAVEKNTAGIDKQKQWETYRAQGGRQSYEAFCATQEKHSGGYGKSDGQLANLPPGDLAAAISSPPYASSDQDYKGGWARFHAGHEPLHRNDSQREAQYGETPGQLGAMLQGDHAAAISSPPFIQTSGGTNVTSADGPLSDPALIARHAAGNAAAQGYGETPANLGNMAEGEFGAAVSSPPYEANPQSKEKLDGKHLTDRVNPRHPGEKLYFTDYANQSADGSLGIVTGDNFWSAARLIVEQTFAVLRPGGHAVFVVKAFVRGGRLVDFPGQWRQLCEAVGFVALHEHRAWVVEDNGTQLAHDGQHKQLKRSRKSFFAVWLKRKARQRSTGSRCTAWLSREPSPGGI